MPTFTRGRTRLDDSVVFERARCGDDRAFAELLSRFRADVHRYCLSRTHDAELAADLTQEVFARVLEAPADHVAAPRQWLFGVARNVCLDAHRAQGRSVAIDSDAVLGARVRTVVGADQRLLDRIELQNVLLALSMLRPRYRNALIQRGILRLSTRAMAAATGSTAGATDTLVSRARDALLRAYRELDDMPGECRDVAMALHRNGGQHGASELSPGIASHVAHCARCQAAARRATHVAPMRRLVGICGLAATSARDWLSGVSHAVRDHASVMHAAARLRVGQPLADAVLVTAAATSFAMVTVPFASLSPGDTRIAPPEASYGVPARVSDIAPLVDDRGHSGASTHGRSGAESGVAHDSTSTDHARGPLTVASSDEHEPTSGGAPTAADPPPGPRGSDAPPMAPDPAGRMDGGSEPAREPPVSRSSMRRPDGVASGDPEGGMMPAPDSRGAEERRVSGGGMNR